MHAGVDHVPRRYSMRLQLLATALLLLSAPPVSAQASERDRAVPLPAPPPACTKPCVLMRIEGIEGRSLTVVLQTTPARPSIAGADSTGRLVLTTPVSVAVPGIVDRLRIKVQSRNSVRVTFDGGSVPREQMQPRIWGTDILLARDESGFTPMVQYHQLPGGVRPGDR
jgi:hypothetical protein